MSKFENFVLNESARNRNAPSHGIPFLYSHKISEYLNCIKRGHMYLVGGRPTGGKSSFADLHFLLNTYIWWKYANDQQNRPKVKVIYFTMKKNLKTKLQKWLCSYLWIFNGLLLDTITLNGMNGSMYPLDSEALDHIYNAQDFFDGMIESEFMDIYEGTYSASEIRSTVVEYMRTIGTVTKDERFEEKFTYYPGYQDQVTILIVDDVRKLRTESKDGSLVYDNVLHATMNNYMCDLKNIFKVTPVLVVPSFKVEGMNSLSQMVPDFREMKYYYEDSDVALLMFNPHKFRQAEAHGYKTEDFISDDKIARLRFCTIIRNVEGRDNVTLPFVFIPENGFFSDLPPSTSQDLNEFIHFYKTFKFIQINERTKSSYATHARTESDDDATSAPSTNGPNLTWEPSTGDAGTSQSPGTAT